MADEPVSGPPRQGRNAFDPRSIRTHRPQSRFAWMIALFPADALGDDHPAWPGPYGIYAGRSETLSLRRKYRPRPGRLCCVEGRWSV